MSTKGAKTQNQRLDAQRALIVVQAKELLDTEFAYRQQMRAYRAQRHQQADPLGMLVLLEDDPNWVWWTDLINDIEDSVERLRDDYRRITRLMES